MPSDKTPIQEATPNSVVDQPQTFDPLGELWSFFTSTKVAVVLIFVTLAAAFIGAIFIQAPSWTQGNSAEYSIWLAQMRPRYGALTDLYSAIGIFDTYNSVWFRTLCGLLILSTITCTLNRLPGIWRVVFHSKVVMGDSFYVNSANRASLAGRIPLDRVLGGLRKNRYRIIQSQEGDTTYLYADRNGWAKLGTIFTHLSIVLFLIGAVTGALLGFSNDEVVIGEGASWTMRLGYDFQVRLNQFTEEWYPQGMPKDYASDLSVIEGGQEVLRKTIRVNDPMVYRGVKFSQSFYGIAPAVEVKDSSGKVIFSDIMVLGTTTAKAGYEASQVSVGQGTLLTVMRPKNPSGPAAARLEWTITGARKDQGAMDLNKPVKSGDLELTFLGDRGYTGLRVSRDPGTGVIWFASGLMLLGMCSSFYFQRRRLWVRVRSQGVDMAAFADRAVQIQTELQALANSMAPDSIRPDKDKRQK
ncbi:MAG: cytochrome c biogenesis protein ResB [Dehalococcoidia bacterium]|nr:cytochrome c biogenesis protein ResB [Dehalococcoidia bacterium]